MKSERLYIKVPLENASKYINAAIQTSPQTLRVSILPYGEEIATYYCILKFPKDAVPYDLQDSKDLYSHEKFLPTIDNSENWSINVSLQKRDPDDIVNKIIRGDIDIQNLDEKEIVYYTNIFYSIFVLYIKYRISLGVRDELITYCENRDKNSLNLKIRKIRRAFNRKGSLDPLFDFAELIVDNKELCLLTKFRDFRNDIMHYSDFDYLRNPTLLNKFKDVTSSHFLNILQSLSIGV